MTWRSRFRHQCAEALKSGETDIAIIPSIEYQRINDQRGNGGHGGNRLVVLPEVPLRQRMKCAVFCSWRRGRLSVPSVSRWTPSSRATVALAVILAS